jgi:hypothetical protein
MERLKSIIYKFAVLIALISLITSIINGVSLYTSMLRSVVVFLVTLVIVVIVLHLIRKILIHNPQPTTEIESGDK